MPHSDTSTYRMVQAQEPVKINALGIPSTLMEAKNTGL